MTRSDLDARAIAAALAGSAMGRRLQVLREVDSTMSEALRACRDGAPDGTVIIADYQTAGRGRMERTWTAPAGTSLLLSIVFRPSDAVERLQELPMCVALGALRTVRGALGEARRAALKWPNDIVVGGAKLAGLLAESEMIGGRAGCVVVGLGLNVHQDEPELPPGGTSLRLLGAGGRRDVLAAEILGQVEELYGRVTAGETVLHEWSANLATLGHHVAARSATGTIRGRAVAVEADGALVVQDRTGRRFVVRAGDVTLGRSV